MIKVAVGGTHSVALTSDGRVITWGDNSKGQTDVPPDATNVIDIAAGPEHTVLAKADGTVACLGSLTLVPAGLSNIIAVATGLKHTLALRADGRVVGWAQDLRTGLDTWGQENVPVDLINVVAIDAIQYHSAALCADGRLLVWGGVNPMPPPSDLTNAVAVAAGYDHVLALRSDGTVAAWGYFNQYGETNVPSGLQNVRGTAAGFGVSTAIDKDGHMIAWGKTYGIPLDLAGVQQISVRDAGLAVLGGGPPRLACQPVSRQALQGSSTYFRATAVGSEPLTYRWRCNGLDLLGATNSVLALTNLQLEQSGAYSVVISNAEGIATSGNWDLNVLGVIPVEFTIQPQSVSTYLGADMALRAVAAGSAPISYQWLFNGRAIPGATGTNLFLNDLRLDQDGTYSLMASNAAGALESERVHVSVGLVVASGGAHYGMPALPPGLSNAVEVSARSFHNLALTADGTVIDWGAPAITPPPGVSNVVAVAAGTDHSLALRENGTVSAWGSNDLGQATVPPGVSNITAIAAGDSTSLALAANGILFCWGKFQSVNGLLNISTVAAGQRCVITGSRDGIVTQWNEEGYRELQNLTNVVALSGSPIQQLALQSDGRVLRWSTVWAPGFLDGDKIVAIGAGGGSWLDHYHYALLNGDGGVVADQYPAPATVSKIIGVAAATDYYLYLLRNPDGGRTMRLGFSRGPDGHENIRVTGAAGQMPLILEESADLSRWQSIATNWIQGTASQFPVYNSNSAVKYFRVRQL